MTNSNSKAPNCLYYCGWSNKCTSIQFWVRFFLSFLKCVLWKGNTYIKWHQFHSLNKSNLFFPSLQLIYIYKTCDPLTKESRKGVSKQYIHKGVTLTKQEHNQKCLSTFEKDFNWTQICLHKWNWFLWGKIPDPVNWDKSESKKRISLQSKLQTPLFDKNEVE